jgi:hypothetical protein
VRIPVIGVTGKYQSGKTLFALSIAPGQKRTRVYDFELSASGYRGLDFDYVDVPATMRGLFGQKEYRPIDVFRWWQQDVLAIQPGSYAVIVADPITDIESGLVDFVASEYAKHGFSSEKSFVITGGIFWSKVREHWKRLLADLASRCETFIFTAHLKKDWVNGKPTSKDKPGGKTTLLELASLYLWLDRSPDPKTGKVSAKPRCHKKLKDRLSYTSFDQQTMEPVILPYLPPAFDDCSPSKIREYVQKPADYGKLKTNERVVEEAVSEIDKLEIERQIAQAKADAEASALERLTRQAELRQMSETKAAAAPQPIDVSSQQKAAETVKAAVEKPEEPPFDLDEPEAESHGITPDGKCTPEQAAQLVELKQRLGLSLERFEQGIAKHTGGSTNPLDLTRDRAAEIIRTLTEAAEKAGK